MGMILISLALRTSVAGLVVKSDCRLTFQKVVSQINDWTVTMLPDQTKVHS